MPGYNHYSWCMCGWCYKTGSNGYSRRQSQDWVDHDSAQRTIASTGANRSYSACFVVPNAKCPECGESVFYYQNEYGSRVFFDELGWPWPKHPCTDKSNWARFSPTTRSPRRRSMDGVVEIAKAAQQIDFDPAVKFRFAFGGSPWDLLSVIETARRGFETFIKAQSISPYMDEPVFITFVSAKIVSEVGDYFGFNGEEVSVLETATLSPRRVKARRITAGEFASFQQGSVA
jgi:hypothetical protein